VEVFDKNRGIFYVNGLRWEGNGCRRGLSCGMIIDKDGRYANELYRE